ncbi:MAG: sugar ABC transporter ATP-binding protein [Anaerolineae bacterium]
MQAVSSTPSIPILEAQRVNKRFGNTVALHDATLVCQPGSIHALVGENGAGKSTLIKIVAGVVAPDSGTIKIGGSVSTVQSPAEATRYGIVPVFQELSLLPDLTIAENIFISSPPVNRLGIVSHASLKRAAEALCAELGFEHLDPNALVREIPLAQRQLVEIAKAFSHDLKLLILDEGTSALSVQDVKRVFEVIRRMRDQGRSVIFISHRMSEVEEIADTLTIFRDGQDVGSFPMGAVSHEEMVQLMIGRKLEQVFPPKPSASQPRPPLLEVDDLSWEPTLHQISLRVGKGEIVGLGGLDGQGQGELLFALFGVLRGVHGRVRIDGQDAKIMSPSNATSKTNRMALIPEDRKTEGLILPMSVADNSILAVIDRLLNHFGLVDTRRERGTVQQIIEQMQVKVGSPRAPARSLSGGNQQKVVIGKWLLTDAQIYLLHDPTRGIDVGTKQEIYQLIRRLADNGAGVLFFSTELSELVGMCDRVLVLYEGRVFRELRGSDIREENIVSAALGLTSPAPEPQASRP